MTSQNSSIVLLSTDDEVSYAWMHAIAEYEHFLLYYYFKSIERKRKSFD
jgi:hypothetical protein